MRNLENATDEEMDREFAREQRRNNARASSSLDENMRLFLQHLVDHPPDQFLSCPMMLDGVPHRATIAGFLDHAYPVATHKR